MTLSQTYYRLKRWKKLALCLTLGCVLISAAWARADDNDSIFNNRPSNDAPVVEKPHPKPPETPPAPPPPPVEEKPPARVSPQPKPATAPALTPPAAPEDPRTPIPSASSCAAATQLINEVFKDDMAAARKPADKLALAQKLIAAATDEPTPAGRYELLTLARDRAIEANDFATCCDAVDRLVSGFRVDKPTIKRDTVLWAWKLLRRPADRKNFARLTSDAIDVSVSAEKYDMAREVADLALASARQGNDPVLTQAATAQLQRLKDLQAGYAEVKTAMAVLAVKPNDPDASATVGRFRCFVKGDWESGLPLLAAGSDAKLKELAAGELKAGSDADVQLALADGWCDLGAKQPAGVKTQMLRHAGVLYRGASPGLSGLTKMKVEKKLKELDAADAGTSARAEPSKAP